MPREMQEVSKERHADSTLWDRLRESVDRLQAASRRSADPAARAQKLAARAALLRTRMAGAPAESPVVFLALSKGRQRYGIPIGEVLEVQALEHFTPVPGAPPFLPGVIHWRGAVLTLLDLGRLFEIPEPGIADVHACVIVEASGQRVGVIAQEIDEIYSVPPSRIHPPPELPGSIPPDWILGVEDDNRLILRMGLILRDARFVDWQKR
jgi:purine-binding chemotaxis protein CheW